MEKHSTTTVSTDHQDIEGFKDEIKTNRYGWGEFKPKFLQEKFNTGYWFLCLMASINFLGSALTNGMIKVRLWSDVLTHLF